MKIQHPRNRLVLMLRSVSSQAWQCMPVIPVLERKRQEDQEMRVVLTPTLCLMPAWDNMIPCLKEIKNKVKQPASDGEGMTVTQHRQESHCGSAEMELSGISPLGCQESFWRRYSQPRDVPLGNGQWVFPGAVNELGVAGQDTLLKKTVAEVAMPEETGLKKPPSSCLHSYHISLSYLSPWYTVTMVTMP